MEKEQKKEVEDKKTNDWAEMSDEAEDNDGQDNGEEKTAPKPKKIKPAAKGYKNKDGDYVVNSIDIPDMRTDMKTIGEDGEVIDDETDSDTEYDEEDDNKDAAKEDETKEGKYHSRIYLISKERYMMLLSLKKLISKSLH